MRCPHFLEIKALPFAPNVVVKDIIKLSIATKAYNSMILTTLRHSLPVLATKFAKEPIKVLILFDDEFSFSKVLDGSAVYPS